MERMKKMKIRQYTEKTLLFLAFLAFLLLSCLSGKIAFRMSGVLILAACLLFAQLARYLLNSTFFAVCAILDHVQASYVTSDFVFRAQSPYKSGYWVEKSFTHRHFPVLHLEETLSFRVTVKSKHGFLTLVSPYYLELCPNTRSRFVFGKRSKIIKDVHPLD